MDKKYKKFLDLVIYQIYPKSFNDTNGDGMGDIRGVIEKLDYLQNLGVNAIWLCPCYPSPGYDNGYDISNYRDVMPQLGTLDDIKELIAKMHKRKMKLFMDLVPNHTSHEHEWFKQSRQGKDNPYSDYYYWFDKPQNDWKASFGGTAWDFDEVRGQYYLHSYTPQQPDLNWDNPQVVKEMQAVVDYWVNLGVDGFRIDVIDQISKNFDGANCFGPRLHEYINALFGRENTAHLFTVGECWANDIEEICRHSLPERGELSTLFQFDHIDCGRKNKWTPKKQSLTAVRDILVKWQKLNQKYGLLQALFSDNHDQNYYLTRVGNDRELRYQSATCLATMFYLLRGVPFIYQGQEFGAVGSHFKKIEQFNDVESTNAYDMLIEQGDSHAKAIKRINYGSRDNTRRPMAWDNSKNCGFSEGEPWIALGTESDRVNLENDVASEQSVFQFYQSLLKLRKENAAFRQGKFKVLSKKRDKFFIFERKKGKDAFTVVCNFETEQNIPLAGEFTTPVLQNYADRTTPAATFRPYEIAVYKN